MNVVLVGLGRLGQIRLQQIPLINNLKLIHIIEESEEHSSNILSNNGCDVSYSNNLDKYLRNNKNKIDGIWITTPTSTHKELIEIISQYNNIKCIGVEKPVTMNPFDTKYCYDICKSNNIELFCSFQRRQDKNYMGLYNYINTNKLGKLYSMSSIFRDHPIPCLSFLINGGDLFHDCGVHDIDFARYLNNNANVTKVMTYGQSNNDILNKNNVKDLVKGLLLFDNNISYTIEVSRIATYGYDQRFECFGENGYISVENIHDTSIKTCNSDGIKYDNYKHSFPQRFEDAFRNELNEFRDVLLGIKSPFLSCLDALRATQISEACRLSMNNNIGVSIKYDNTNDSYCTYFADNNVQLYPFWHENEYNYKQ